MANYRYTYDYGGRRYEIDAPKGATAADLQAIVEGSARPAAPRPPAPKPKPKKEEDESFLSGVIPVFKSATGRMRSELGLALEKSAPFLANAIPVPAPILKFIGAQERKAGERLTAKAEAERPAASVAEQFRQAESVRNATPYTGSRILAGIGRATALSTDLLRPALSGVTREFLPQTPEEAARTLAKVQAPFQTRRGAAEFIASQAPATLIPLGGGKAVQVARGAFLPRVGRDAAKAALARDVGTGVVFSGGAINASSAGGQAYRDVLAAGGTQEEADRAFKIAALGAAAVSGAATRMPGVEQLAFADKPARGGILRSAGRAVIGEAPQEFVEEAGAQLATNVGKLGTAAETPVGEDVLSSGLLGAIGGATIAAPIGGLQGAFNRGAPEEGGAPPAPSAPRAPRTPPPPADMGALAQALGPVGGKIILQEPSGPQEYTYQGFDEDGGVILADADGIVFSEDPDQVQAAIKAGVAEPESGLGGMAFGMDVADEGTPPPPPPPPPRIVTEIDGKTYISDGTLTPEEEAVARAKLDEAIAQLSKGIPERADDIVLTLPPEFAPPPPPPPPVFEEQDLSQYTPQQIAENITAFSGQEARRRGYEDDTDAQRMFVEGVRDASIGLDPLPDDTLLQIGGQEVLTAYKDARQWAGETIAAAEPTRAPMTLQTLPQQLLMTAREQPGGIILAGTLSQPEVMALEEAGIPKNEAGNYEGYALIDEADRRSKAGEIDKSMSQYDNSHIPVLQERYGIEQALSLIHI